MATRRAVPTFLAIAFAFIFFGLGNYLGARQYADSADRLAELRAEVDLLRADATKAREKLGWQPEVPFRDLVDMMVDADLEAESRLHAAARA